MQWVSIIRIPGAAGDQVTFQGSYFFNGTRTVNRARTERWYEEPAPIDTLFTDGYSRIQNFNNRLNARIEWKSPTTSR